MSLIQLPNSINFYCNPGIKITSELPEDSEEMKAFIRASKRLTFPIALEMGPLMFVSEIKARERASASDEPPAP